jgi:hypothetical protein
MSARSLLVAAAGAALALCAAAETTGPTVAPGPYYATPSWDQKLPSATRFVILSNWDNLAVLDRETGLVWQTSLKQSSVEEANFTCWLSNVGGRGGWRLPTLQELLRTLVKDNGIIADSPFDFLRDRPGLIQFNTATTFNLRNSQATRVLLWVYSNGTFTWMFGFPDAGRGNYQYTWCVQSPASGPTAISEPVN